MRNEKEEKIKKKCDKNRGMKRKRKTKAKRNEEIKALRKDVVKAER